MGTDRFLAQVTEALINASEHDPPRTDAFASAMDCIVPVFDHLGTVLQFAKADLISKNNTIKAATAQFPDVQQLVQADVQANRVAVKGSLARNLHRLRTVLLFVEKLMQNLAAGPDVTLSSAASDAYADSLGPYHSTVMRGTCNAGFLLLPTRLSFLKSIGETEETGVVSAKAVCPAAITLIERIDKLYDKPMPASTNWF